MIRLLVQYLRPFGSLLAVVVVLQFVQTMANLWLPRLNAVIIDDGIARGDTARILSAGATMLALCALQITAMVGAVYCGGKIAAGFGRDLRAAVFRHTGTFSAREVNSFGAATLITRCTNDVQQLQTLTLMMANMLVSAPIAIIGGVYMALREDVQLSWLLAVCIPALVGSLGLIVVLLVPRFRLMQQRIDTINGTLREQLTGIRVVRAFAREKHETERFDRANIEVTDVALQVGRLSALMFPIMNFVFNASAVAVIWFGAYRVDSGGMEVGSLVAFINYLMQILMSATMATFVATMMPRAFASAERINEVLSTHTTVQLPSNPVTVVAPKASVEFVNAGFQYPNAQDPVLSDINFVAHKGQMTAIVGSTGAGKTTLANLIPRLIDATSGIVLVNGIDVKKLDAETLAKLVAIVPQQSYLFSGTVSTNLRYGDPDATDEDLWRALEIAQAADFVHDMPDKLQSPISQGGTNVSGGQRQRLAIARAIVSKPQVYVFDDAFSALDTATDARLQAALKPLSTEAAMVVVAQRVSSIRNADQIVVLDDGHIVGIGTHSELLESCETYQEIVTSQLEAGSAA